jgi:HD superfamily phosphohydrolase
MISSGIRFMIEGGTKAGEIKAMDDLQLFTAMTSAGGYASEMVERIKSRKLFKRAVYIGLDGIEPSLLKASEKRVAQEIADLAGVNPEHVLVDNPGLPDAAEGSFPALMNGELIPLRQVSPLVAILERAQRVAWRFGVYCQKEDRERVSMVAAKYLNLKKNAVQHTLADIDYGYL